MSELVLLGWFFSIWFALGLIGVVMIWYSDLQYRFRKVDEAPITLGEVLAYLSASAFGPMVLFYGLRELGIWMRLTQTIENFMDYFMSIQVWTFKKSKDK